MDAKVAFETERLVVRDWADADGDRVYDIYRRGLRRRSRSAGGWGCGRSDRPSAGTTRSWSRS
jgi:hypothetical protein